MPYPDPDEMLAKLSDMIIDRTVLIMVALAAISKPGRIITIDDLLKDDSAESKLFRGEVVPMRARVSGMSDECPPNEAGEHLLYLLAECWSSLRIKAIDSPDLDTPQNWGIVAIHAFKWPERQTGWLWHICVPIQDLGTEREMPLYQLAGSLGDRFEFEDLEEWIKRRQSGIG